MSLSENQTPVTITRDIIDKLSITPREDERELVQKLGAELKVLANQHSENSFADNSIPSISSIVHRHLSDTLGLHSFATQRLKEDFFSRLPNPDALVEPFQGTQVSFQRKNGGNFIAFIGRETVLRENKSGEPIAFVIVVKPATPLR